MCHAGQCVLNLVRAGADKKSGFSTEAKGNSSKLAERRGNVYENKGPLWKMPGRSGNVCENKTTYAL
jgi:hypothetical protein